MDRPLIYPNDTKATRLGDPYHRDGHPRSDLTAREPSNGGPLSGTPGDHPSPLARQPVGMIIKLGHSVGRDHHQPSNRSGACLVIAWILPTGLR
jgi:hypothetical protein